MHMIAAKAVCFHECQQENFKTYAAQMVANAKILGEALQERGFHLVSGGTDNHLLLVNVKPKGLTGKEMEELLEQVGITCNKNTVPFDEESPFVTSGIRIGTPALTTRGMKEPEMEIIAEYICRVLDHIDDEEVMQAVKKESSALCEAFPLYSELRR